MKRFAVGMLLLIAAPLFAATPSDAGVNSDDYVRYLLPVIAHDDNGAYGSKWRSIWSVHNTTDETISILYQYCNPYILAPCIAPDPFLPHKTLEPYVYTQFEFGPSAFIYVPKPLVNDVAMQLRIQDVSRQSRTWGTELPIVDVLRDYRSKITLLDVPADARFRSTLRIYGSDVYPFDVVVRTYTRSGTAPVREEHLQVHGIIPFIPIEFPYGAAYTQLDPVPPGTAEGERLRIEITSDVPMWAFVSVTNNETQHVTTITPQE